MRSFAVVLFLALIAATSAAARSFSDADRADLDRVSAYLNSIRTMKGGFVQIGPDGQVDQGAFFLSKPGRIRFQYDPPAPTLIVSDGTTLAVANSSLKTIDRYPIADTPFAIILDEKIDLKRNRDILAVAHEQDALVIKARSSSYRMHADIALTFSEPDLELRQWTVVDNQGLSTTVALRQTQTGIEIPASQFMLPDKNSFTHKSVE